MEDSPEHHIIVIDTDVTLVFLCRYSAKDSAAFISSKNTRFLYNLYTKVTMYVISLFNYGILKSSCFQLFNPVKSFLNFLAEEVELNAFNNTLSLLFAIHPLIITGQFCFYCIRATIVCSGDHSRVAELYVYRGFLYSRSHFTLFRIETYSLDIRISLLANPFLFRMGTM